MEMVCESQAGDYWGIEALRAERGQADDAYDVNAYVYSEKVSEFLTTPCT